MILKSCQQKERETFIIWRRSRHVSQIKTYLTVMRERGCAISTAVALGVGLEIARKHGSFATGPGKDLFLTKDWAKSLFY